MSTYKVIFNMFVGGGAFSDTVYVWSPSLAFMSLLIRKHETVRSFWKLNIFYLKFAHH